MIKIFYNMSQKQEIFIAQSISELSYSGSVKHLLTDCVIAVTAVLMADGLDTTIFPLASIFKNVPFENNKQSIHDQTSKNRKITLRH
jgi:hypothetical protein